jgi:NAD(P)-dependent dehydrogenase (short-subunit alcohol dehydrogenase family)
MIDLSGKVCLITGAGRTLGAAIARRMAQAGAHVAVHYFHSQREAEALCAEVAALGVRVRAFQADVTDSADVARLLTEVESQLGTPEILVNNVGPYADAPFLELALADFDRVVAGNVRSTFMLCQAVGRRMKERGAGRIVNIAATDAFHRSHSVYGLAKSGVIHLTEAFALELAPEVAIFALAPDLIADNEGMSDEFAAQATGATPMKRLVTRAEVAEIACLLCTPAFSLATGHTVTLDGGRSIPRMAL